MSSSLKTWALITVKTIAFSVAATAATEGAAMLKDALVGSAYASTPVGFVAIQALGYGLAYLKHSPRLTTA